jgi:hypothetical protein
MWSDVGGLTQKVLDIRAGKNPKRKFEQQASKGCHNFEYLTLLNTSSDATTRDQRRIANTIYGKLSIQFPQMNNEKELYGC